MMVRVTRLTETISAKAVFGLVDRGDTGPALLQARQLVEQTPMDPAAWRALGYALVARKSHSEAGQALLHAIALAPKDTLSWEQLATFYRSKAEFARAIDAAREALAADEANTRARLILANCQSDLGRQREAIAEFRAVLAREPDNFRAHNNLANLLSQRGQLDEAAAHYNQAAQQSPELTYKISAAYAARRIADWAGAERLEHDLLDALRRNTRPRDRTQPFPLIAVPGASAQDQLAAGRQLARTFPRVAPVKHALPTTGMLRIGYISSDFHDHATAHLLTEALELHDRARFEIIGFDFSSKRESASRNRILKAFDRVVSIAGTSDLNAARRIATQGIAIAVDLKGWTAGARPGVFAHRPAPISAQWLGYPGSTGMPWIDYAIVDSIVAPQGSEAEFSEKLVRLPDCYQPNDRRRIIADPPSRAAAGLPPYAFVYCCFNQPFKITPEIFALWLDLLKAASHSVLWLKDDNRWATAAMRAAAAARGIASERVIFGAHLPLPDHLARLSLANLALDCAPCGSHTTASDALWAGVPHIAYLGDTFSARVSSSLVSAVGMPQMIVRSTDEYRALALRLANEPTTLAALRTRLAANRLSAPLFDSQRFVRHLEAAYQAMWQRQMSAQPPDHITVAPITQ